jgi:hypothetical protein
MRRISVRARIERSGRVVEDVALEGARGLQGEAGGLKALREAGQVGERVKAEFDLGFDGHGLTSSPQQ